MEVNTLSKLLYAASGATIGFTQRFPVEEPSFTLRESVNQERLDTSTITELFPNVFGKRYASSDFGETAVAWGGAGVEVVGDGLSSGNPGELLEREAPHA